ncbi:putative sulfite oxidase cytochrome subunit [Azorhizobium caulinodans ORS 571]|uniref:Putative sulfite oxidase cytochrome subunit n=1 Tax=Azorhizobium caulinodans (strain ATCC 43989 / DSM 5975 / JCM 20966 / LMG 6465 / NBRC 14845 / NCIMB 13405 / ORS 571) TaxID=438753 RepID=A8IC62_AZOC5|nr:cytochrome c [Azorhizobium caulinodans]BAF89164.1 putative sulfite oxidase cytochrome subunit [Azorhizobium caulinodans ORS 571]
MRPETRRPLLLAAALTLATTGVAYTAPLGIGHPATQAEIALWDIDVRADGTGLPPGRGSVAQGREIFAQTCSACHGEKGQGAEADALAGGKGTLATAKPVKTVGSFWPYAATLFDYVNRAMPFTAPQSLSPNEVYAVSAYVLFLNGLVPEDASLDAKSLPKVAMPNRNGFTSDPRPDIPPVARN